MKYLFVCVSLALFAYIEAVPYNNAYNTGYNSGYNTGYDSIAYQAIPLSYGSGYGSNLGVNYGSNYASPSYRSAQPLYSAPADTRASAASAASSATVKGGPHRQYAVPGYAIDAGYHGNDYAIGAGY